MKIATWNVERLKHFRQLDRIASICDELKADILVLTETDSRIKLNYDSCYSTVSPHPCHEIQYGETERRVSIYTNYPLIRTHETFDENTSICTELMTEHGNLLVYGTIIGVYGNRHISFKQDLAQQLIDYDRLSKIGALCICGDFNCSFSDNYYHTEFGRQSLQEAFQRNQISLLTKDLPECIDHIALSDSFGFHSQTDLIEWNKEKALSVHKGVMVTLEK